MISNRKNDRLYTDANRSKRPDLCAMRRKEAQERQSAYDKLSAKAKLDRLDAMFGVGKGASRERARLAKALEKAAAESVKAPSKEKKDDKKGTSKERKAKNK